MADAYRCRYCGHTWPRDPAYEDCPQCLEPCRIVYNQVSLHPADAEHRKMQYEFGWWLWANGRV